MTPSITDTLHRVQLIRKAVLFACILGAVAFAAVTQSLGGETDFHQGLEFAGLGAIAICIVGRAWCSLYIGGRKKAEIVDMGPYSISRNPLYVFSFFGAFGIGAQTGSLAIAVAFVVIAWLVFRATVQREEVWLAATFGETYTAYVGRTPRFWPKFSQWRDRETLEVQPVFFLRTIKDGLVFLLAVPIFEGIEHLQDIGWLQTLIHLP
ncbi:methyltransferase family protein [Brevundimonas sp.]|uniref:methyltransferase family protein n=1 Tax=Brevundimonas sp. TaxID=1871086 RepID=UPI003BAA1D99